MKILISLLTLGALLTTKSVAQPLNEDALHKHLRHRNIAWYTPPKGNTEISGLALGVYATPANNKDTLKINGLNIELDPGPIIFVPFVAFEKLINMPDKADRKRIEAENSGKDEESFGPDIGGNVQVNGLNFSTGIIVTRTVVKGVAVNILCGIEKEMKGVEITGLVNEHNEGDGLIIAPVNILNKGRGLQLGLYNRCRKGPIVQIGLINKIGKRTLPIINFSFKRRETKSSIKQYSVLHHNFIVQDTVRPRCHTELVEVWTRIRPGINHNFLN